MILTTLVLDHFRNHITSSFSFGDTTIIIGKNTAGKTNILESLNFLSSGKSFRAEKDTDVISEGHDTAKITAKLTSAHDERELKIITSRFQNRFSKKFLVNNVPKRQFDFISNFYSSLFTPEDLTIISSSPGARRKYIDSVLLQASRQYRVALTLYEKTLRQRNRMLSDIKDSKKYYNPTDFIYWDNLLIEQGTIVSSIREEFVIYINAQHKEIFSFDLFYDKSTVSPERLEKYYDAERASGVTLVGPQRDEFIFYFPNTQKPIREFGSRGEQRLTLLQMKVFEILYLKEKTGEVPTLLLDDIFSELDSRNIEKVFELIPLQQTIITTTHKEFVPQAMFSSQTASVIELGQ